MPSSTVDWRDLAERAGWTAAEAVVGVALTEAASLPVWWAAPIATGLSAVKTWIAGRVSAYLAARRPAARPGGGGGDV